MKKLLLIIFILSIFIVGNSQASYASVFHKKTWQLAIKQDNHKKIKEIQHFMKKHNDYANAHNLEKLKDFYAEKYQNNDGFNKQAYIDSVKSTWDSSKDITYDVKILSIDINGDYASVYTEEKATGTVTENHENFTIDGEIHALSKGVYHLEKSNNEWLITGETAISEESKMLYGNARFLNIDIQAPEQVAAGSTYTVSVKADPEDKSLYIGYITTDKASYPSELAQSNLKPFTNNVLERIVKANNDNVNEFVVSSVAVSQIQEAKDDANIRVYVSGLACIIKRVNVVPKNDFIKLEDKKDEKPNI